MAGTATRFTRERVDALREELSRKFAGHPTARRAILSILEPLSEGWEQHDQGMTVDSVDALEQALGSPLDTLVAAPVEQCSMACDQLCIAWDKVRGKIEWIG